MKFVTMARYSKMAKHVTKSGDKIMFKFGQNSTSRSRYERHVLGPYSSNLSVSSSGSITVKSRVKASKVISKYLFGIR